VNGEPEATAVARDGERGHVPRCKLDDPAARAAGHGHGQPKLASETCPSAATMT
jgi:hypothetical protein